MHTVIATETKKRSILTPYIGEAVVYANITPCVNMSIHTVQRKGMYEQCPQDECSSACMETSTAQ